jgi:hypothetical protein
VSSELWRRGRTATWALLAAAATAVLAGCGGAGAADPASPGAHAASHAGSPGMREAAATPYLPAPAALAPFGSPGILPGQGRWRPAGRLVHGFPAVYETWLVPPGGTRWRRAAIAWLDTRLLSARLYSGSISPGGGHYRYTAPIAPAQAATLVAAFNGGFKMKDAHGGYYAEGRMVDKLRPGAASLVIYADGSVNIGAWGTDVTMTSRVVSVRQNLVPLVASGQPTPAAAGNWHAWGSTCGAQSCAPSVPGLEHQWRTGLGITADGALVYAAAPALDPLQLAELLVRAGAVRGMELDINPNWPDFVTYHPPSAAGLAAPSNGRKLIPWTVQGVATFFQRSWARDFVTMSARPLAVRARGGSR